MVGEDTTGLVGAIVIDQADLAPSTDASIGAGDIQVELHDDATLAQALRRLAAHDPVSAESSRAAFPIGRPRLRRGQFTGRLTAFWAKPAVVTANLDGLAAELQQVVAQVLRRISASR